MTGLWANKERRHRSALLPWGSPWSCGPAPLTGRIQHTNIGRGDASRLSCACVCILGATENMAKSNFQSYPEAACDIGGSPATHRQTMSKLNTDTVYHGITGSSLQRAETREEDGESTIFSGP